MSEPQIIKYGGVQFNKSDVKKASEKTFLGIATGKYEIELKDGTVFSYSKNDQIKEHQPKVLIDKNKVIFEGINKGKITDTKKADNYELNGCQSTYVDTLHLFEDKKDADTVKMNDKRLPDGKIIKSKDNSVTANKHDDVSGKNKKTPPVDNSKLPSMYDPTNANSVWYN